MSDLKNLRSFDLESITIIGTSISFIWGIILGIALLIFLIVGTGIINGSLFVMMFAVAFGTLILSIPQFFGVSFLYNHLINRLRDVQVKITDNEAVTNVSIVSTSLIVAILSLIVSVIIYPVLLLGVSLLSPTLQLWAMQGLSSVVTMVLVLINPISLLYAFIIPFVFTAIGLFIFNNITPYIGGIKVSLSTVGDMVSLNSVDPVNAGIIAGIISLVLGLISGIVISVSTGNLATTLVMILSMTLGGFVGGFIYGALSSLLYNFLTEKLGTVKLGLEDAE